MSDGPTPAQLKRWQRRVDKAVKALLPAWRVKVSDQWPDDEDSWAEIRPNPDVHNAVVMFAEDWDEHKYAAETLVHEIMHAMHSEVDGFVQGRVFPLLSDEQLRVVAGLYVDLVERYTDTLTKTVTEYLPPF